MASRKNFGGLEFEVEGFSQLSKGLKNTDLGKNLKRDLKDVSLLVVNEAKSRLTSQRVGPSSRSAGMFKASVTTRGASVKMVPGTRYPWAYGLEYGSKKYGQFQPWRGNQWRSWGDGPGYYLTPAVRDKKDEAFRKFNERIDQVFNDLPDATSTTR